MKNNKIGRRSRRTKQLKIAIVCFPTYGGSGAVATDLGIELAKRGHEVHFIANDVLFRLDSAWQKNITFHLVEEPDHPVLDGSSVYVLALANKIAEVCRRYDIDIISTHYSIPHAAAAALARDMPGTKAKVVNTFHGTDVTQLSENLNLKELMRYSLNKCDGLTAVAHSLSRHAEESYSLDKAPKVIHNWIEKQEYPAAQAKELRDLFANRNEKIITHISNFREVKRIQDVMAIFLGIRKKVKVKLLLIGDGPEQRIAHRLITKHRLINEVHVLGLQTNVSRILSISDLFLLPSSSEAFSLAALEAMSFGVPVVATNVGGMPEMIEHGESGFLSEVGDTKSMIEHGIKLLTDQDLHDKVSANSERRVAKEFNAKLAIKQYEDYFEEVLNAKD
ncbi:MAG TPA: N-acetyl-alpha-D-glucosaminyl L-malate synthase BshA [Candidatus Nanoarchaeia archaeon]|nr:N-acetyl-alpha-D-glucosaminyl L-malate synthase BshA [Candidatus Nanoarchaeia archaeon]